MLSIIKKITFSTLLLALSSSLVAQVSPMGAMEATAMTMDSAYEKTTISNNGKKWLLDNYQNINFHKFKDGRSLIELGNNKADNYDLNLSFEEDNEWLSQPYRLQGKAPAISSSVARSGQKSAIFYKGSSMTFKPSDSSFFNQESGDFTIAFWIMPTENSNGTVIFEYSAPTIIDGQQVNQIITCSFVRDKLYWHFKNIFFDTNQVNSVDIELASSTIYTGQWRRHTVRYNSELGILELMDDNIITDIAYANPHNQESNLIFAPNFKRGFNRQLTIGSFNGYLDDITIVPSYQDRIDFAKYSVNGKFITNPVDLEYNQFVGAKIIGQTSADAFYRTYIRFSDFKEELGGAYGNMLQWQVFDANHNYKNEAKRFVQFKVELFAGDSYNVSPSIKDIEVYYRHIPAPPSPAKVVVVKKGKGVLVSWPPLAGFDIAGYKLYFGKRSREYFATSGNGNYSSPIDVGLTTEFFIDDIDINEIYYFALSVYDSSPKRQESNLSGETSYVSS